MVLFLLGKSAYYLGIDTDFWLQLFGERVTSFMICFAATATVLFVLAHLPEPVTCDRLAVNAGFLALSVYMFFLLAIVIMLSQTRPCFRLNFL